MNADDIRRIAVIGAGTMGHGIAQVFARAGYLVRLMDPAGDALERARMLIRAGLHTLAHAGHCSHHDIDGIISRIHFDRDIVDAVEDADFVVEAVPEVPEIKKEVFARLDAACRDDAVLATNTSGLDVFGLVGGGNQSRMVATHFFVPAQIIPLVEVCPGPDTSPEITGLTMRLMEKIGKQPVRLNRFVPSFIVNRIQNYISMAVFELLNNGWASPEDIDRAVKASLGIRLPVVGVVQSLDFTGLDLVHDIMRSKGLTMPVIADKVRAGHLGVKSSRGFFDYQGRSEEEIVGKRDLKFLAMLDRLEEIGAFETI
ncbi:MAG TPA: 3-hydroxyacyl-CoA dehydrogenase NAD-binding domain-containing protein [Spirochaetota bacterium]|nr:3-hydroxyacyl-CoA dehydrogenase NAD-binding domain-containing protein [Spirochaetota bacterium]HPV40434.1 3-hydroxyacyl-CoA dehydrogenase NAD-binding domain-containing protein [Spirochaetota bacterium]